MFYYQRISYQGNIVTLFEKICEDYSLGKYVSHRFPEFGYEDFNVVLQTSKGTYFVKIFGSFRSLEECKRYIHIMEYVRKKGIPYPFLYKSNKGVLHTIYIDTVTVYLCVQEYIDGKNLFELDYNLTQKDAKFFIRQAASVNALSVNPPFVYDSWATINLGKIYQTKGHALKDSSIQEGIELIVEEFRKVDIKKLPHCFVHGDMIKTNMMKDKNGRFFVLDFAVSNYYPRIVELSVLICFLLFDFIHPEKLQKVCRFAASEYQKYIILTEEELKILPLFVKATFASYMLSATYEKNKNNSESLETRYWLKVSTIGLFAAKTL